MGCKLSREAVLDLKGRKLIEIKRINGVMEMKKSKKAKKYDINERIDKNDISLVRESWKQLTILGDYKFYGTIMMIK
jgi:hypothetical protein